MAGLPYVKFYPGDWLRDNVSACSLTAQGLWLRMMFIAHESAHYGFLEVNGVPMPNTMIARKCGCGIEEFEPLLAELDAAGVPERASNGAIYSRRMVRDGEQCRKKSRLRSEAGKAGAKARWQNDGKHNGKTMANAISVERQNDASSDSDLRDVCIRVTGPPKDVQEITEGDYVPVGLRTFHAAPDDHFEKWWEMLPAKMAVARKGCWLVWQDTIAAVVSDKGISQSDAIDYVIHRTRMFLNSAKGQREFARVHAKSFLSDGVFDDDPESWELPVSEKSKSSKAKIKPVSETRVNPVTGAIIP